MLTRYPDGWPYTIEDLLTAFKAQLSPLTVLAETARQEVWETPGHPVALRPLLADGVIHAVMPVEDAFEMLQDAMGDRLEAMEKEASDG